MSSAKYERVLSIQSHVAYGYVGGKAAVFPLQLLGYDVDVVNTVNFSNHAGYRQAGGTKATAADLSDMFTIMKKNGFLRPTRLLTGYVPGAEGLTSVAKLSEDLYGENPGLVYLLDPVIGDAGRLYVAADVIPVYRSMLPRATIITPNWFEVEVLTNVKIVDHISLHKAISILHKIYQVPHVIISSIPIKKWLYDLLPRHIRPSEAADNEEDVASYLLCVASSRVTDGSYPASVSAACVPIIPGYFSGVGDLFSALVLGHYNPSSSSTAPESLSRAASLALTKTHAILQLTYEYSESLPPEDRQPTDEELDAQDPTRRIRRMSGRELRLVQGQDILRGAAALPVRELRIWDGFWNGYSPVSEQLDPQ
ncbi:Ribokinase-like protein [Vararia minispora EC-137]|uniref:Ribokinase-like protein n=1 Tax=Vararia minispora EC-137 TaxID=1314806 RepID=A0ACB8QBF4_9AGAM|nr:Ribokinase-like protein [Vararia minispora EC-137]